MTLEMEAIETSLAKLAPSGWTPGVAYDKKADQELMEEDRIEAQKRTERTKKSGFFSCKRRVCLVCLSLSCLSVLSVQFWSVFQFDTRAHGISARAAVLFV